MRQNAKATAKAPRSKKPAPSALDGLSMPAMEQVAQYFQALAEPTRLKILNVLRSGEKNVGEIQEACGNATTTANISRHLATLAKHGLVARQSRGTSVYYRIADEGIYQLCDIVCGSITRRIGAQAAAFA